MVSVLGSFWEWSVSFAHRASTESNTDSGAQTHHLLLIKHVPWTNSGRSTAEYQYGIWAHPHTRYGWTIYFDTGFRLSIMSLVTTGKSLVQGLQLLRMSGQPYQKHPQIYQYQQSNFKASDAHDPINVGPCSWRCTLCLGYSEMRPLPFPKLLRYLIAISDYLDVRATKFQILIISYQLI